MSSSRSTVATFGLGFSLLFASCYELVSTSTLYTTVRAWTGTGTLGRGGPKHSLGLAGQDIYQFSPSGLERVWTAPLIEEFGGPHVLTSLTQTHTLGHHEHTFAHGNLVGRTDNLDLFYTFQSYVGAMTRVRPWSPRIWDGGDFDIVQVCDMAAAEQQAYGEPNDLDSHLYLSVRACRRGGGTCAGGIVEVQMNSRVDYWWIRSNQDGWQSTLRKADGSFFSNECMPIAVTGRGDQATQVLVVGDPSWDELSVFDASRLWAGPLDALRTPDAAVIRDVTVSGRRDGSVDYAFVATLWSTASSARVEHRAVVNGDIPSGAPHMTESVASEVRFIEDRGLGAQAGVGELYTYGNTVVRRGYH